MAEPEDPKHAGSTPSRFQFMPRVRTRTATISLRESITIDVRCDDAAGAGLATRYFATHTRATTQSCQLPGLALIEHGSRLKTSAANLRMLSALSLRSECDSGEL